MCSRSSSYTLYGIFLLCRFSYLASRPPGYSCLGPASRKTPSKDVFPLPPHPPSLLLSLSLHLLPTVSITPPPPPHRQIHSPSITFIHSSKQLQPLVVGSFSPNMPVLRTVASVHPPQAPPIYHTHCCGTAGPQNVVICIPSWLGMRLLLPLPSCSAHTLAALWRGRPAESQPSILSSYFLIETKRYPLYESPPQHHAPLPPPHRGSPSTAGCPPPAFCLCPPAAKTSRDAHLPKPAGLIIQTIHPQ